MQAQLALHDRWKDVADFVLVYLKEAHSGDEAWVLDRSNTCFRQPKSLSQRTSLSSNFVKEFGYTIPVVVDDMRNSFDVSFGAVPERFFVIEEGVLKLAADLGPWGFILKRVEEWMESRFPTHD